MPKLFMEVVSEEDGDHQLFKGVTCETKNVFHSRINYERIAVTLTTVNTEQQDRGRKQMVHVFFVCVLY